MPTLTSPKQLLWFSVVLWLLSVILVLFLRPLTPIDETRYLSVAWEMWQNSNWLLPTKNGELYSHKPPLLFWLINLSWWLFGVSELSARLITPLMAGLSLLMTYLIARQLFPSDKQIASRAICLLCASAFWFFASTMVKFDLLLSFASLLAIWSLLAVRLGNRKSIWFIFAIGVAMGLLAKGPIIFVHLLPVSLVMPFIFKQNRQSYWYLWLFAMFLLGIGLAGLWAVPAALAGGNEYAEAIFLKQTLERLSQTGGSINAHHQPFWWYLPMLLLAFAPWLLRLQLWRSLWSLPRKTEVLFLLSWFLLPLVVLSLIGGKQLFYLLPEFVPMALLAALALAQIKKIKAAYLLSLLFLLSALFVYYLPNYQMMPDWFLTQRGYLVLLFAVFAVFFLCPYRKLNRFLFATLSGVCLFVLAIHMIFYAFVNDNYDVLAIAKAIGDKQKQGHLVAHFAKYHGQYQFVGRLKAPLVVFEGWQNEARLQWLKAHPDDYVVLYQDLAEQKKTVFATPYRYPYAGEQVLLLKAKQLLAKQQAR